MSSTIQSDKVQLIVGADTRGAINQLGYLQAEYKKLEESKKTATTYTQEQALNNAMSVMKEKIEAARKELGIMGLSQKELNRMIAEHNRAASNSYAIGSELAKQEREKAKEIRDLMLYQQKNIDLIKEKINVNGLESISIEELTTYSKILQKELQKEGNLYSVANQEKIASINKINDIIQKKNNIISSSSKAEIEDIQRIVKANGIEALSVNELKDYYTHLDLELKKYSGTNTKLHKQKIIEAQKVKEYLKLREDEINIDNRHIEEIKGVIKVNGIRGLTTQQLINYSKHLQEELMKESDLTNDLNKKRIAEAQSVNALISDRQSAIKGSESTFANLKGNLLSAAVGGLAGGIGAMILDQITGIIGSVKRVIDDGVEYAKKRAKDISDIQTTLTISQLEASKVYSDLNKIDTTRSRDDLKELVLVAGDLNEEVKSFVPAADKLEKVFERDFGGVGEASTMVAKLKGQFAETKELKIDEAFGKIGSMIKGLNEQGPATTKGITEFLGRIGQLPAAIKPGIAETAALAAVMEEANLTAEISSGGITNVLLTASKNADGFAKQFKMSREEFLQFLTSDPVGFLKKFAAEIKGLDETKIGDLFKTLKIESQESVKVMGVLSENIQLFDRKIEASKNLLANGTRLDEIFNVFNNDTNAQLTKAEKRVEQFTASIKGYFGAIGTSILVSFAKILPDAVSEVEKANKKFEQQEKIVNALDGEIKNHIETIKDFKTYGHTSGITQDELKKAIDSVAKAIPSAISMFDSYGNAMDINTEKAEKNIIKQRELMREAKNDSIKANKEAIELSKKRAEVLQTELNRGYSLAIGHPAYNNTEIERRRKELAIIQEDIKAAQKTVEILEKGFSLGTLDERRNSRGSKFGSAYVKPTQTTTGGGIVTPPSDKEVNDAKKLQEEVAKNEAKLIDEIEKMHIDSIEDETQRNIEKLKADFNREVDANYELVEAKKLSQSSYESWVKAAQQKLDDDIAEINDKAREKQEKADLEAAQQTAKLVLEARLADAEAAGDTELILQTKIALRKQQFDVDIEKATAEQKLAVWEKYLADVQKMQADADYKTGQNEAKGASKLASMIKKGTQAYIKELDAGEKLMLDFGKSTQDALFSVVDARFQKQEMRQDKSLNKQQKSLEKQLQDGLITEDEFEKRKTAIEKRHELEVAKIRRKQAIAEKANALASIAINTAIGASKVLGQTGMFGIPAVAFVIAQGAMQAATVLAQPLPALPALFTGGYTPDKGAYPVNDGLNGMLGILHPNEFVLNAKATSSPVFAAIRPILESANAGQSITSMSGGSAGPVSSSNNGDILGKLTDAMMINSKAIIKLESKLDDLKVRLAPYDIEFIGEEINYQSGINQDAMIYNSKLKTP